MKECNEGGEVFIRDLQQVPRTGNVLSRNGSSAVRV